ncbi:MAG: hypothetical protein EA390_14415 [Balneolaceae bacterium]|nr:MAG: hypothetical protein EA390_14415 [Balneolaceae bacterium]
MICMILFQLIVNSCASDSGKIDTVAEIIKLDEPIILIHYEDKHLASPMLLKTTSWDHLLVYDSRLGVVKAFDGEGKLRAEFGERGQGPGEYQRVGNFALFDDNVYLIDDFGFAIHKFHYDSNGNYNYQDSFTYDPAGMLQFPPLPPMPAPDLTYVENLFAANTLSVPYMAGHNILLVPSILNEKWLYDLTHLDGSFQGGIGKLANQGIPELNYEKMRSAVSQREIPELFYKTAFPVTDKKNPEELFLVSYTASNISKINLSQNKDIWKTDVSGLSEINAIKNNYFKTAVAITNQADAIIPFFAYTRGISTQTGDLYLSTYTTSELPMWIHKFNNNGELQVRYRISSEFELLPVFEVDTIRGRFLTISRDGEILAFYY